MKTITRIDGDNKPLTVNVETGLVERVNTYYLTRLKTETARWLFLSLAGIVRSEEFVAFIKACNQVAARKRPATKRRL